MHDLVEILVPLGVCVALPVLIIWLVSRASINRDNKRTQVLIEAIRQNNGVDTDKLAEALKKPEKTPAQLLMLRLLRGCIFSLIGIALVIFGIMYSVNGEGEWGVPDETLVLGGLSLAVGISYLIVYFVSKPRKYQAD